MMNNAELRKLNKLKIQLKKEIEFSYKEVKKVRNLRIFKGACKFIYPFIVSTGIVVGGFKLFGFGFPFNMDKEKKYKAYELDFQTGGSLYSDETYVKNEWYSDKIKSNIKLYSPWKKEENNYSRIKRLYEIKNLDDINIYNAVIFEDYNYIMNNIIDYTEEIQYTPNIDITKNNNYWMSANITLLDKNDFIVSLEDETDNLWSTILCTLVILASYTSIESLRKYRFLKDIKNINSDYKFNMQTIKIQEDELNNINQKLLIKTKGDNND